MGETMKYLVTGFEPFGGNEVNASWEAVARLGSAIDELAREDEKDALAAAPSIVTARIPVEFGTTTDAVMELVAREQPDVVLLVGEYGGRPSVTPELVAINHRYAHIPDNAGSCPRDERVVADGPDAHFATVPVYRMAQASVAAGVDARVSYTAGTYICNDVFYGVLHRVASLDSVPAVGFIHVPWTPAEATAAGTHKPSMSSEVAARSLAAMILDLEANGLE